MLFAVLNHGLGDWFDLGPKSPGVSQLTPISLTATAIYYYDVKLLAEMAGIRNKPEKENLQLWAEEIRSAFNTTVTLILPTRDVQTVKITTN